MKVVIVLCFVGALLVLPRVFQRDLSPRYTAALILVMGLNPYFWDFKDEVLSDIPFLFFTLLSLWAFQRERKAPLAGIAWTVVKGGAHVITSTLTHRDVIHAYLLSAIIAVVTLLHGAIVMIPTFTFSM